MAYKISGSVNENATIFIIRESDGKLIRKDDVSSGSYSLDVYDDDTYTVISLSESNGSRIYSNVTQASYAYSGSGNRALVGHTQGSNVMHYFNMVGKGNSADFGDYGLATNEYSGACSNGTNDRGVWAGGWQSSYRSDMYYFTISTTGNATSFGALSQARSMANGLSNHTNDRGIFAGGTNGSTLNTIDYITISSAGAAADFGDLITARRNAATLSNGTNERGIIATGENGANIIEYITISTTSNATDFGDLDFGNNAATGTSNLTGNRGLIYTAAAAARQLASIQYININSTGNSSPFGELSNHCEGNTAAVSNGLGNMAFFCGGDTFGGGRSSTIDYTNITTIGHAESWGSLTSAMANGHNTVSNS